MLVVEVDCKTVVPGIFCERGRPERKAVWIECKKGEGEWGETLKYTSKVVIVFSPRASQPRIATSENDCFAVYRGGQ